MDFRILGPLEVADAERAIALDAPKQRALLGLLLLHANEVVSSERAIDELWGERPPATAEKVLQTYVSQLRRTLGPDAIITRSPGYLLRIEEDALDAGRFHHLAAEARRLSANGERERAHALFSEALALWRGPPLADVAFASFARNEVERLREERLDALTGRIDCELELGRHEQLVAELESLVREYPFRERLRAQLMLALYRSGRQAEALAAYQDARRTLTAELGLEPSRELQDLEKAILTHDPALESPPAIGRATAKPVATASGRVGRAFARGRLQRLTLLGLVVILLLALALGLAFSFRPNHPGSILLVPNSVGFIDAKSGRVIKSYPVGRGPSALTVTEGSVWVANYQEGTVTRISRASQRPVTIPVAGHPTGITATRDTIWIWTLEGFLVRIDPRYNQARRAVSFARELPGARNAGGRITSGGGFLWITVPPTTVIRADAANPRKRPLPLVQDEGVQGSISYRGGKLWIAGADQVFPLNAKAAASDPGARVGAVRDLVFDAGSLWVASGGPGQVGGVVQALRRVNPHTLIPQATVQVGSDPIALAAAGGSIWVAGGTDGTVRRVDPASNRVVDTISLGAKPTALAPDRTGVWVAVR